MKKHLCFFLCSLLVFLTGCSHSQTIRFGAADIGGMYYSFANSYSGFASKDNESYKFEVKNTAGSAANLRLLSDHYIDLGIAQTDLIQDAYNGRNAFENNICRGYQAVSSLYTEACQIVVRNDSDIQTLDDLQGRKVSIGAAESGTERNAKEILSFSGLNDQLVETVNLDYTKAASMLASGKIDAFFCTAGIRTTVIDELSKECKIRLLSIDEKCMKKLQKAYPFYVKYTIPANTYSGQSTQVETLGVKSILLASDNLSDETVKEITRLLFKHGKDMQYATSLNLNLDEKTATHGVTIPFHPGAASYYKDKGITVNTK